MNIEIVLTGKPKSKFIVAGVNQYLKWLSPYYKVGVKYLPLGGSTSRNRNDIKKRETMKYLEIIKPGDTIIVMDERGDEFTSLEFANELKLWQNSGANRILILVGGPLGFSNEILGNDCYKKLAISKMTFTHEMALLFILEQIYRADSINRGKTYHY